MSGYLFAAALGSLVLLTLVSALGVATSKHLVHAGYWLMPTLIGVAGLFATLGAHFLAVVQVLVYVGAILVLIVFALMLTRDIVTAQVVRRTSTSVWALASGIGIAVCSAVAISSVRWPMAGLAPADAQLQTKQLGQALIGRYALPFEAASVLLLAALAGAIVLARADRGPLAAPAPNTPSE